MPPRQQPQHDPAYLDEHHQRISEFAADYFEDDEERELFIDTLLERRGYQRQSAWALPPPDPGPGGPGSQPPAQRRAGYFKK